MKIDIYTKVDKFLKFLLRFRAMVTICDIRINLISWLISRWSRQRKMLQIWYRQGKKIKTKPSSTQSRYLLAKGEKRKFKEQGVPTLSMPMTEGLVALYTEELLLDQFEFLNDHWQFVLQENKPKRQSTSPRSIFWLHRKHLALNRYQHICRYWEWEPKIDEELTSVS